MYRSFRVAIDHITYYAIQAEDEVTAIDLVLEGEGEEMASETRDAFITAYQPSDAQTVTTHGAPTGSSIHALAQS